MRSRGSLVPLRWWWLGRFLVFVWICCFSVWYRCFIFLLSGVVVIVVGWLVVGWFVGVLLVTLGIPLGFLVVRCQGVEPSSVFLRDRFIRTVEATGLSTALGFCVRLFIYFVVLFGGCCG